MQYKRRHVPVYRDFPKGCGVGESLMPFKFEDYDLPDTTKALSNHCETETETSKGLCNSRDVELTNKSILESDGGFEDHQEKEILRESEYKGNQTSSVKKLRMSLDNSIIEVGTDVVNTTKRVVVSGLAAHSNCHRSQPKNRGSRQEKRRWKL